MQDTRRREVTKGGYDEPGVFSSPEVGLQLGGGVVDHGTEAVYAGAGQSPPDALLHDVKHVVHHAGGQLPLLVAVHGHSLQGEQPQRPEPSKGREEPACFPRPGALADLPNNHHSSAACPSPSLGPPGGVGTERRLLQTPSEPHLVDSLPHEVLLHGDVVADELLHGAAQQAVVEQLVQLLLMLCKTSREPSAGPRARKQLHLTPCCLPEGHPMGTHLQSSTWNKPQASKRGAGRAELTFAGDAPDFRAPRSTKNLNLFSLQPLPVAFVPTVTKGSFNFFGHLVYSALQSLLRLVSY